MSNCRDEHVEAGGRVLRDGESSNGGHEHGHGHGHGHGHHDHECDHSCSHDDPDGNSLLQYIDTTRTKCLNSRRSGVANNCFKPYNLRRDREKFIHSEEDDPELILYIPFLVAVNLKSICISGPGDGSSPSEVWMFRDRSDVDFDLAHDLKPTVTMLTRWQRARRRNYEAVTPCSCYACVLATGKVSTHRRPGGQRMVSNTTNKTSTFKVNHAVLPGSCGGGRCVHEDYVHRDERDSNVHQDDQQSCCRCQLRNSTPGQGEQHRC